MAKCNYTRQCWPAVSVTYRMWGGPRAFSGPQYFYSCTPSEVKSFCMHGLCLCLCQSLFALAQPLPPSGWVLVSI